MKKINNKYRNNNNNYNSAYSLNYKFDSNSIAGKISGTALELIKKYNDLAKDAQSNSDYVSMEVFRQYAEHYRKIVTDINERRNAYQQKKEANAPVENAAEDNAVSNDNAAEAAEQHVSVVDEPVKKEFKVVEISAEETNTLDGEQEKTKRHYRKKAVAE